MNNRGIGPATLAMADQALVSGTNMGFVVLMSHISSPPWFGAFSIAFSGYLLSLGISRSLVSDAMLFGRLGDVRGRQEIRGPMLSAAMLVGLGMSGMAVVGATFLGTELQAIGYAAAIALPWTIGQDALRTLGLVERRYGFVLGLDAIWAALQFIPSLILLHLELLDPRSAVLLWGASAASSVLIGMFALRVTASVRAGVRWVVGLRHESKGLILDFAAGQGVLQLSIVALAMVASPVESGAVRIAQTALGPVSVVVQGAQGYLAPRMSMRSGRGAVDRAERVGAVLALMALTAGTALALLPTELVAVIFGEAWFLVTLGLLAVFTVEKAMATFAAPFTWVLRGRGLAARLGGLRLVTGGTALALAVVGASLYGAVGVGVGLLIGSSITSGAIVWLTRRSRGAGL